jgi:hypothetical protein
MTGDLNAVNVIMRIADENRHIVCLICVQVIMTTTIQAGMLPGFFINSSTGGALRP